MKMRKEHFAMLREWIGEIDSEYWRDRYRRGQFHRSEEVKDLNVRYRWDLFWAALGPWDSDHNKEWRAAQSSYGDEGLYDSHIDTALRRIVPPL